MQMKFNLIAFISFSFLVIRQAAAGGGSSSSSSSKGGTHTIVSIDEWSLTRYVSAHVIFVDIGYFPFGHSVAFVHCPYMLLINIFSPCIVGGRKVAFCIGDSFLDTFWKLFLDRYIAFLTIHELLLIGRKTKHLCRLSFL